MSTAAVQIRGGGSRDLDAVMAVMDDSFDSAFGEAWTAAQCAGLLPMTGVWLLLATRDDQVVGFALARRILNEAELLLLAVRRGHQRQGIGEMLLAAFVEASAKRGAQRLHLEVRDGNHAVKLYGKFGFAQVGRRRNYYTGRDGQVYDALTLAKTVSE